MAPVEGMNEGSLGAVKVMLMASFKKSVKSSPLKPASSHPNKHIRCCFNDIFRHWTAIYVCVIYFSVLY